MLSALTMLIGTSLDSCSSPLIAKALIMRVSSDWSRMWYSSVTSSFINALDSRRSASDRRGSRSARFARGCSRFKTDSCMAGAFTSVDAIPPPSATTTASLISIATSYCASSVDAPRCGVAITAGCAASRIDTESGCLLVGSLEKQSSAAPASWPLVSASSSASSSMIPPRAAFTMRAPRFMCASLPASRRFLVESNSGRCSVTKSPAASASSSPITSTPTAAPASLDTNGS
mmetsp:Transcript_11207/g.30161  ORF Transcript_11207/g.30161 Transcript_11207/m.30161 type:complete len:232 (-) Transcript_11207:552-1247(-)